MNDEIERLEIEAQRLRQELRGAARDDETRDKIRSKLLVLGREIDARMHRLQELKDSLRDVAGEYRRHYRQPAGGMRRIDHLGGAAYRERGWSALAVGAYDDAARLLAAAADLDPDDHRAQALLAWSFIGLDRADRADEILEELLSAAPDIPLGRMVLGYLQLRTERLEDAVATLSQVAAENADPTAGLYANLYLGMAYSALDRHREAKKCYREALELGPNLTEAYWELGCSHIQEGRPDLARECWRMGGENRYSFWGERCRNGLEDLEAESPTTPST